MEVYYDMVLKEYDQSKKYDYDEINRCIDALEEYLYNIISFDDEINSGLFYHEIDEIIDECYSHLEDTVKHIWKKSTNVDDVLKRIEPYKGSDQQRTEDWFDARRSMLTASIAQAVTKLDLQNKKGLSFLREKIRPKKIIPTTFTPPSNPDAAHIRGIRYEPIIRKIYEHIHQVKVEEYDCIPHEKYSFLGASPDGIVTNGFTKGRMVEIKCPKEDSAKKDGLQVKPVYWCQMQLQMEVCDLELCDYVRTVIKEAPTLKEIQVILKNTRREYQKSACSIDVGHRDSQVIAAGTIWMDSSGNYHHTDPLEKKFRHETSIMLESKNPVLFVRHFALFYKDLYIKTVSRNRNWFTDTYLPKAIESWNEIQKGREDPDEWEKKYPSRSNKVCYDKVCLIMD
jgi:putative phage-type endonuclease